MSSLRVSITTALVLAAVGFVSGAAGAAPPDEPVAAGDATIVDANNRDRPLYEGDSTTIFSLRLPDDATCPGDSANDDWRIQSFLVPDGVDPGSLEYGPTKPSAEGTYSLRGVDTRPWVSAFLAQNPAPGQPGEIPDPPSLIFGVLPGSLADGRYQIGVVCHFYGKPANYWAATVDVSETKTAESDLFQSFTWRVPPLAGAAQASAGESGSNGLVGLAVAVTVVAIAAALLFRARRRSSSTIRERI